MLLDSFINAYLLALWVSIENQLGQMYKNGMGGLLSVKLGKYSVDSECLFSYFQLSFAYSPIADV